MATKLKTEAVDHLAVVMNRDGREWAPRNGEAVVLGTKGAPTEAEQKNVIAKVVDAIKGALGYPVSSDVPDDVDNDGDGADDYNDIASLLTSTYYDLNGACGISDDDARSKAVVAVLQGFKQKLDAMYVGKDDDATKAGARHSAADASRIAAIQDAHDKLGKAFAAAQAAHEAMKQPLQDLTPSTASTSDTSDDDAEKAKAKDGAPKPYGDVEYADPKNGKYPIDTAEHARAAWAYINKQKNADEYSADDLASVKSKIEAACKKFGIEISADDSKAAPAEESEMTKDEVAAMIADALKANTEAVKAEAQAEVDAAKAEADKAKAEADTAKAAADKAKADQEAAEKASREAARQTTGTVAETPTDEAQKARKAAMLGRVKAALGANPEPTRF